MAEINEWTKLWLIRGYVDSLIQDHGRHLLVGSLTTESREATLLPN